MRPIFTFTYILIHKYFYKYNRHIYLIYPSSNAIGHDATLNVIWYFMSLWSFFGWHFLWTNIVINDGCVQYLPSLVGHSSLGSTPTRRTPYLLESLLDEMMFNFARFVFRLNTNAFLLEFRVLDPVSCHPHKLHFVIRFSTNEGFGWVWFGYVFVAALCKAHVDMSNVSSGIGG